MKNNNVPNKTEALLKFLNNSPVNFFAVKSVEERLLEDGYSELKATDAFTGISVGSKFYVKKNDSAIFAFNIGKESMAESGFHLLCAHSDSPTFRIKPNAEIKGDGGIVKLNTEVYGGAVLSTWFDRPLSLAGRVVLRSQNPMQPECKFLKIGRALLQIPNLAIHFNRQVNDGVKLSKQKDMLPIIAILNDELEKEGLLTSIIAEELKVDKSEILDFDLYLYDTTPACLFGLNNEFISAGRLDDLSMVHAGLEALLSLEATPETTAILAIFDNEETGSQTKQGAGAPFLANLIERVMASLGASKDDYYRAVERAFMISADNAHAWHPNYSEKYDPTNHPVLGGGPVIKFNAAQKYASDAVSSAVFKQLCEKAGVPCQNFVNHSDVAGGSTLGNILSASLPVRGVDMGNPVLAMHSARETGSVADHEYCIKAFSKFFELK